MGVEFQVNSETYLHQFEPTITPLDDDGYLVIWTSYGQDGDGWGVFAQRYDADNLVVGTERRMNTYETNNQSTASVSRLDDGGFVVVWSSYGQGGLDAVVRDDIYGQRFDSNGNAVGTEFKINSHTDDIQASPVVAGTGDGGFMVVWTSEDQDGDLYGIFGQKYDVNGDPDGVEFQVNTESADSQIEPSISALADGGVVVTWSSDEQDGHANGIFGQMYDQDGQAVGSEFQVNTTFTHVQEDSSVSGYGFDTSGGSGVVADAGFVVAWLSFRQHGDQDWAVYVQRYDADGQAVGDEFRVNSFDYGNQTAPVISALNDGGFVVTWVSNEQDGDEEGIFGQRYDADGNVMGGEFQINSFTDSIQYEPSVTGLEGGDFVVTWSSYNQDGRGFGVFGQNFDAEGNAVGVEYQINSHSYRQQDESQVTALADGGYIVSWTSQGQDGRGDGIYGQRFDADGNPVADEFQINTYTRNNQSHSDIDALADGGYIVTWSSDRQDGSQTGVYAQQFDVNGVSTGGEFLVNTTTRGYQSEPVVTGLEGGGYVIAWNSYYGEDGSRSGVYAQRFDEDGNPEGDQFLVNTYTERDQEQADISALSDGGFIITWTSDRQDGSEEGIFGQRYDENGVTVGDEFQVNTTGNHMQAFSTVAGLKTSTGSSSATSAPQPSSLTVTHNPDGSTTTLLETDQSFQLASLDGVVSDLDLLALDGTQVTQVAVTLDSLLTLTDTDNTLFVSGDSSDKVLLMGDGWVQGADTLVNGIDAATFINGSGIMIVEDEIDVLSNYSGILPDNF